jgi:hypothetical protein
MTQNECTSIISRAKGKVTSIKSSKGRTMCSPLAILGHSRLQVGLVALIALTWEASSTEAAKVTTGRAKVEAMRARHKALL